MWEACMLRMPKEGIISCTKKENEWRKLQLLWLPAPLPSNSTRVCTSKIVLYDITQSDITGLMINQHTLLIWSAFFHEVIWVPLFRGRLCIVKRYIFIVTKVRSVEAELITKIALFVGKVLASFVMWTAVLLAMSHQVFNSWDFLTATYGFM